MATERITIKLPDGFDPAKHSASLVSKVNEAKGGGFDLDNIDIQDGTATLTRQAIITEVSARKTHAGPQSFEVKLPKGTKPADGPRVAAKLEDQHGPGVYLTRFDPFLFTAELTKLSPETARCRGAAALALGCKEWDVQVAPRHDGGFDLTLPKTYVPSRHDSKLTEVAEAVVGRVGWYWAAEAQKLTGSIIPSDPPTFLPRIHYPLKGLGKGGSSKMLIGQALPEPGEEIGPNLYVDFDAAPHIQLSGTTGSGKAQPLTTRLPVPLSARFPAGWATVGELESGDEVFCADSTVTTLHGLTPVLTEDIYEVTFDDGQIVQVTGGHLWTASSAAARHIHSRKGDANPLATAASRQEAEILRAKARTYPAGIGGTLPYLAELAGISVSYATALTRNSGLISTKVEVHTHAEGETPQSQHAVQHFLAEEALYCLTTTNLPINSPLTGTWMSAREIADYVLGRETTKGERASTYRRLIAARVASKTLRVSLRRLTGDGKRAIHNYPIGEFLYIVAAARESGLEAGGFRTLAPLEQVVDTETILGSIKTEDSRVEHNWAVRIAEPFQAAPANLAISPYVLGAWLSDDHSYGAQIFQGRSDSCTDAFGLVDQDFLVQQLIAEGVNASPSVSTEAVINTRGLAAPLRAMGLLRNKHIPATYLRASAEQRLALLQGLMDTDGTVNTLGSCELTLTNERLALQATELIRSLGIKASITTSPAAITEDDPDAPGMRRRRVVGDRHRIRFTTTKPVFRLPRKAARLKTAVRSTQDWLFITSVRKLTAAPARCLHLNHPEHLYLTGGFIPTHNSVLLHGMIADRLAAGAELVIIDLPHKAAVDFIQFMPYVRNGGWGCGSATMTTADWLPEALTALALVFEEGFRRAKLLADHRVTKVDDLPASARVKQIFVVMDEVTGILQLDDIPKGVPKDHQMVVGPQHANLMRQMILSMAKKIAAELRFADIHLVLSSQVSSVNTGIPTALRMCLTNKILQGPNPTDGNRKLSLSDASSVPYVPDNVRADRKAAKGVGVAELEGQTPSVYKSFYATPEQLVAELVRRNIPTTTTPRPSSRDISKHTPSVEDSVPKGKSGTADDDYGYDTGPLDPETGKPLTGYAKANAVRHQLTVDAKRIDREKAAEAGTTMTKPKTASTATPRSSPMNPLGLEMCASCDRPIDPMSGCACSR